MSILQFMDMTVVDCISYVIISILVGLSISGLGQIIVPRRGIMVRMTVGMTFVATWVLVAISFAAVMAKYIIYSFVGLGALIFIYKDVYKNKILLENFINVLPFVIIATFFLIRLLLWIVPEDGVINFNCHSTYFSGIAMELTRAEYWSRIRIYDVYPYEWSTYHFFNSAYTGLVLTFMPKVNYVSYLIAKYTTIAMYMGAVFEMLRSIYGSEKAAKIFAFAIAAYYICAFNMITWSSYTNNYSCIFMFMLMWLSLLNKDYLLASLLSLGFAISAGRCLLPGGCMFLYFMYQLWQIEKIGAKDMFCRYKAVIIYIVLLGIGAFFTAFTGQPSENSTSEFYLGNFWHTYFNQDWISIMPLGALFAHSTYKVNGEFVVLLVYVWMLYVNRMKLNEIYHKHKPHIKLSMVFMIICSFIGYFKLHISLCLFFGGFFIFYIMPISVILLSQKDKLQNAAKVFILFSLLQGTFFGAGISMPNYCMVGGLAIWCFIENFMETELIDYTKKERIIRLVGIVGIICICVYSFEISFWSNPKDHYHKVMPLEQVQYSNVPFEYNSTEDGNMAILNAMKGNRIHYNIVPTRSNKDLFSISMSMSFLPKNYNKKEPLQVQ